MTTHSHTYIRCGFKIFMVDAHGTGRELHHFETEKRAKRWQVDQNKKRPGSCTVGAPPKVAKIEPLVDPAQKELARRREIAKLAAQQAADQAMTRRNDFRQRAQAVPPGKTGKLIGSYVAPDQGASSFLRARSKKREQSRGARNTRATFGVS